MKKFLLLLSILATVALTSCEKDDPTTENDNFLILSFDYDYDKGDESNYWESVIDNKEYNGELLYSSTTQYTWTDKNNTLLSGCVNEGSNWETGDTEWMLWSGGIVVSNYYLPVVSGTEITYENQLSVSNGKAGAAGHNGSANFAVVNDGSAGGMLPPYLTFSDSIARTIDHLYISSTSYLESVALDGNNNSEKLENGDTFTVTATGYDADNNEVGKAAIYELVADGALVKGWNKWDLSSLGEVVKIKFTTTSNKMNSYGTMSLPTNFAIDDIAVVK